MIIFYKIMGDYKNYFTFSNNVQNLLFKDITVSSNEAMVGLCFGVALFTIVFEAVKSFRHYLVILQIRKKHSLETESSVQERTSLNGHAILPKTPARKTLDRLKFHSMQTLLHMIQLSMGYMIMLILMSYNAWLLITVIITTALCFYFHEYVLSMKSMILPVEVPKL